MILRSPSSSRSSDKTLTLRVQQPLPVLLDPGPCVLIWVFVHEWPELDSHSALNQPSPWSAVCLFVSLCPHKLLVQLIFVCVSSFFFHWTKNYSLCSTEKWRILMCTLIISVENGIYDTFQMLPCNKTTVVSRLRSICVLILLCLWSHILHWSWPKCEKQYSLRSALPLISVFSFFNAFTTSLRVFAMNREMIEALITCKIKDLHSFAWNALKKYMTCMDM